MHSLPSRFRTLVLPLVALGALATLGLFSDASGYDASPGGGSPEPGAVADTLPIVFEIAIGSDMDQGRQDSLANALNQLCPCFEWYVKSDGTVGNRPRDLNEEELCDCLRKHTVGCNLLGDLAGAEDTVDINGTTGGNSQDGDPEIVVEWNPSEMEGGPNSSGDRKRPPSVGLAHELIHAHHEINGNDRTDGDVAGGLQDEEQQTTRGENQIREELGEPARVRYGGMNIDSTKVDTTLDASLDRYPQCEEEGN